MLWENQHGFRTGRTQTELHKHIPWLGAGHFGFRKYSNCSIHVAKKKRCDQLRSY